MKINFDEVIDRYNTNCAKWDETREKYGDGIIHLGVADMDFKSPEPILEELRKVTEHGVFGYTVLNENYFRVTMDWMKRKYDWDVERDWIVFCPRISVGVSLMLQILTNEGDGVIVQSPGYSPLRDAVVKNNRRLVSSPLKLEDGKYHMDFEDLEKRVDSSVKVFILCSPHNPVGRVWTRDELLRLGEFCIKHDLIIISDEIHADMLYSGYKHYPMASLSKELQNRTILCSSITKTFNVPGIILSNLIIPNEIIRNRVKAMIDRCGIHNPNIFSVPVLEAAYTKCDDWLQEVLNYIEGNYNYVENYLNENMPKLKIIKPQGTYLLWIDCREMGLGDEELEDLFINKAKVGIYLGSVFGPEGRGFIRMNIGTSRKNLEEALERVKRVY